MDIAILLALSLAEHAHNIPTGLLKALCTVESGLNPMAIHEDDGHGTSVGLCQVQARTARSLGYKGSELALLSPVTNAKYAAMYLSAQHKRYGGSWTRAIVAYNKGHSSKPAATNLYFRKVMTEWKN